MIRLARSCSGLTVLNLSGCKYIGPELCHVLAENCNKLQKINLSSTMVRPEGVQQIIESSPELRSIDLRNCLHLKGARGFLEEGLVDRNVCLKM